MTSIFTKLCAAAAMAVAFTALPAQAAGPVYAGGAELQNAQFSFGFSTGNDDNWRHRDRFERRGGYYYYNGHRGYRDRQPGFRFHNGYWFPQSAFRFGITIDGNRDRYDRGGRSSLSQRHIAWCEDHYRSYRASDNTFQPYNGPRKQCVSPYLR